MLQLLFSKGFKSSSTYFSTLFLVLTQECRSLLDLLASHNLLIPANYLMDVMESYRENCDDKKEEGEGKALVNLMKVASHLLELGVSVTERDSEKRSVLSLTTE
jgi:hypothetical protein